MAKLSKKQAQVMAELINGCTCWHMAVRDELSKVKSDSKKVRQYMGYHDRDAAELNAILGVKAVVLYNIEAV
jgi:hypothetical protein